MNEEIHENSNPVVVWLHKNRFYASTPIAGLSLINSSKYKWEVLIWYILFIGFAGLTVRDAIIIVKDFYDNPTMTTSKIIERKNAHLTLEDLYVDLQLPHSFLNVEFIYQTLNDYNLTEDEKVCLTRGSLSDWPNKIREDYRKAAWGNLQNITSSRDAFLNYTWPSTLLTYLIMDHFNHDDERLSDETSDFRNNITKFQNKMNITGKQFYMKFSPEIKTAFGLSVTDGVDGSPEIKLVTLHTIKDKNCSASYNFSVRFRSTKKTCKVTWKDTKGDFKIYNSSHHDPLISMHLYDADGNWAEVDQYRNFTGYHVRVNGVYETELNCQSQTTENCTNNCILTAFNEWCKCQPKWLHDFNVRPIASEPICSYADHMNHFNHCVSYEKREQKLDHCKIMCDNMQPCHRTFSDYVLVSKPVPLDKQSKQQVAHMEIQLEMLEKGAFMSFTEEERTSWSGFVAEIGGIIDVYIGASIIGIIHCVMFLIKQCIHVWNEKTTAGKRVRSMFKSFQPSALIAPAAIAMTALVPQIKTGESVAEVECNESTGHFIKLLQNEIERFEEKQRNRFELVNDQLQKQEHEIHDIKLSSQLCENVTRVTVSVDEC